MTFFDEGEEGFSKERVFRFDFWSLKLGYRNKTLNL
jgi:hypothetical protein